MVSKKQPVIRNVRKIGGGNYVLVPKHSGIEVGDLVLIRKVNIEEAVLSLQEEGEANGK